MTESEYLRLFKYMQHEFSALHKKIEDGFAQNAREHLAIRNQVGKHESWIQKVARAAKLSF